MADANHTPTVIVADDVEDARNYIKRILDNIGIKVLLCANGKELMELINKENFRFDLILLDLSMPQMSGLEVLQNLQDVKKEKNFKVCILSGYNDSEVIAKTSELKADDFLTKPFDKSIFLNRIRNLLGLDRSELAEFAFAKVKFPAAVLRLPVLATFNIVGVTEEGVTIESAVNYRKESILTFSSKAFCEAIGFDQEFNVRVLKTQAREKDKFIITTSFFSMPEAVAKKIRAFAVRNAKSSASMFS
ncbi:MAG: response regulator [Bdellovibrionota bacterium]